MEGSCYQSVVGTQNCPVAIVTKEDLYLCCFTCRHQSPRFNSFTAHNFQHNDSMTIALMRISARSRWTTLTTYCPPPQNKSRTQQSTHIKWVSHSEKGTRPNSPHGLSASESCRLINVVVGDASRASRSSRSKIINCVFHRLSVI